MAKKTYIGINGVAKNVTKLYVGVNDQAKKVLKGYVGDSNGQARLFYDGGGSPTPPYVFAGRTVYRHDTLPGSVVIYDEFGTEKKLFVADAVYRGTSLWRSSNADVPALTKWPHFYYLTNTANTIDDVTGSVNLEQVADLTPYESMLTDAWFQAALASTLQPVLKTAKEGTDLMIASGYFYPSRLCRNLSIGVELQVPNIYQLLVMYAMGDVIDSLDPTLAADPSRALGKYVSNMYRWRFGGVNKVCGSSEYGTPRGNAMFSANYLGLVEQSEVVGVAPVAEI